MLKNIKTRFLIPILIIVLSSLFLLFLKNDFKERNINIAIQYDLPSTIDYKSLETDTKNKTTFGMINKYSISSSIEDGYNEIIEQYGSLKKAKKIIENNKNISLDGYLFTNYLLSYLGGVSKNIGIPNNEETITLNNGEWIHYYNFPKMENEDTFEVYITWNDGIFYYIEIAYQDDLEQNIIEYISNAKLNKGNGYIPN